jgi:hypothetical protein
MIGQAQWVGSGAFSQLLGQSLRYSSSKIGGLLWLGVFLLVRPQFHEAHPIFDFLVRFAHDAPLTELRKGPAASRGADIVSSLGGLS